MKLIITFKDPDAVYDAVTDALKAHIEETTSGLCDEEKKNLKESRREAVELALKPWIKHGEYLRVEFDTDAGTAIALKH